MALLCPVKKKKALKSDSKDDAVGSYTIEHVLVIGRVVTQKTSLHGLAGGQNKDPESWMQTDESIAT